MIGLAVRRVADPGGRHMWRQTLSDGDFKLDFDAGIIGQDVDTESSSTTLGVLGRILRRVEESSSTLGVLGHPSPFGNIIPLP